MTTDDDPARHAETADSLSLAMLVLLVLLERLSPEQRAVLLLREVFGYGYPEVCGDPRQGRGQRAPAHHPAPLATSSSAGPASKRRVSSAR